MKPAGGYNSDSDCVDFSNNCRASGSAYSFYSGSDDPNDDACCLSRTSMPPGPGPLSLSVKDCVFNGNCYAGWVSGGDVEDIDGDGVNGELCRIGYWTDCDRSSSSCTSPSFCNKNGNFYYVAGGETSQFGEYDTGSETECCGDDSGENYRSCEMDGDVNVGCGTSDACCDNVQDCVLNGNCYSSSSIATTGSSDDKNIFCGDDTLRGTHWYAAGTWYDCDEEATVCSNYCGYSYSISGEGYSFGEYAGLKGTWDCCGDDSNEYVAPYCPGVSPPIPVQVCCDDPNDEVNANGDCVTLCCALQGETCTVDGDCCAGLYCSDTAPDGSAIAQPYCCPTGEYWNEGLGECRPYASCYDPSDPSYCNYLYDTSNWWSTLLCIPNPPQSQACCPAGMIGDPWGDGLYHYWGIQTY